MSTFGSGRETNEADVVVVGGGLAGLTAGAVAARAGRRVVVLDAHRVGGRAVTTEHSGARFNQGAHALYRHGAGWSVLAQLGIVPHGGPPAIDRGSALAGDVLRPLPITARQLVTSGLLSPRARVQVGRLMTGLAKLAAHRFADRSGAAWLDSLGLRDDARAFVAAMVRLSSYVADHDLISADVLIGQLQISMSGGVCYLDHGWQQLVDALTTVIVEHGGQVIAGRPARSVARDGHRLVVRGDESEMTAQAVVLAAGGPRACADLLADAPPRWRALGSDATAACLDLASTRPPVPPFVLGIDRPLYLSNHCPPADLAPDGVSVVSVMQYRSASAQPDLERDRRELTDLAGRAGIGPNDIVASRYLHRMVVVHGLPSPSTGGLAGRPPVAVDDGVFVAGDWVGPVGWLADGSFASGEAAGHLAAAHAGLHVSER